MKFKIIFNNPSEFYSFIKDVPKELHDMSTRGAICIWSRHRYHSSYKEYVIVSPRGATVNIVSHFKDLCHGKEYRKAEEAEAEKRAAERAAWREERRAWSNKLKAERKAKRAEGAAKAKAAAEAKKIKKII